ncbi:hypothetical protein FACS1894106_4770 [Spirochaetia bacterium]|nr:hypothetical protein FACS1894106_4770 [Spirochaetia bacterium]
MNPESNHLMRTTTPLQACGGVVDLTHSKYYTDPVKRLFFPILTISVVFAAVFSVSCSRSEPRIPFGFIELVYYQESPAPVERFSFFVISEDDDGIENLDELRLFHDREGLRWTFKSDDWISYVTDSQTWIGSRGIAMPGNDTLPRGQYRAVLVNKGGEKTERAFTFDAPESSRFPFPSLVVAEGRYRFDSQYPENKFICYDAQGNFVKTLSLENPTGDISSLDIPSSVGTVALWAEDSEYSTSAMTDLVSIR